MGILREEKLFTGSNSTCGWTAIQRNNGKPISYVREISPLKVNPPQDIRMLAIFEKGAQCILVLPIEPQLIEYFERHEVEVVPNAQTAQNSYVIGCRCRLEGVSLRSADVAEDKREIVLIFTDGDEKIDIILGQDGTVIVETV